MSDIIYKLLCLQKVCYYYVTLPYFIVMTGCYSLKNQE